MGKPSLKKQLVSNIISLALVAIFLGVSFVSFAWFAKSEQVSVNGLNVSLGLEFNNSELTLYPVTEINGSVYTFLSNKSTSTLPKYDKFDIENSEFKRAAVMHLRFNTAETFINLKMTTNSVFPEGELSLLESDFLSNVVSFYVVDAVTVVAAHANGANTGKEDSDTNFTFKGNLSSGNSS